MPMRGVKAISGHGVVSAVTLLTRRAVGGVLANAGLTTKALAAETRHKMGARTFILLCMERLEQRQDENVLFYDERLRRMYSTNRRGEGCGGKDSTHCVSSPSPSPPTKNAIKTATYEPLFFFSAFGGPPNPNLMEIFVAIIFYIL